MAKQNAIDIASYQSGINLSNINCDATIIKATDGVNYVNPAMTQQANGAIKSNKLIGFYHYARGGNYKQEANFFLRTIKPYLKRSIIVLDYEGATVTYGGTWWAKSWLDYVYNQTGVKPLIYLGLSDENIYNWSANNTTKYSLWFAQYDTMNAHYGFNPNKKLTYGKIAHWKNSKVAMYQYTSNGRLQGYNAPLDLDVYYGSKNDWLGHSNNNTGKEDIGMVWHPKVKPLEMGQFIVTKKGKNTTVWDSPDVTKRSSTGLKLSYGAPYVLLDDKNGFLKLGKKQWVDSATGLTKKNKLYFNHKAKCTGIVVHETRGYAKPNGKPTGRKFLKNEKYKTHGYISGTDGGYLIVGVGNNKYIPAKDIRIIL